MALVAKVQFSNVGRDKKSWTAEVPANDDKTVSQGRLREAVRKQRAIMSKDVEFDNGGVFVGGFRIVGEYKLEEGFTVR